MTKFVFEDVEFLFKQSKSLIESSDEALKMAKRRDGFSSQVEHELILENIKKYLKDIELCSGLMGLERNGTLMFSQIMLILLIRIHLINFNLNKK